MIDRKRIMNIQPGSTMLFGILLIIIGIIALVAIALASLTSGYFFGIILICGGFIQILHGLVSHTPKLENTLLSLIGGALSLVIGTIILFNPDIQFFFINLLIVTFLMTHGIYKVTSSAVLR